MSCWRDFFLSWGHKNILYFPLKFFSFFFSLFFFFRICLSFTFSCTAISAAVLGLPLIAASMDYSLVAVCGLLSGFSCCRAQALGTQASVVVARERNCSTPCRTFPNQGLSPCPLHWLTDSYPLYHQGSPKGFKVCSWHVTIVVFSFLMDILFSSIPY